MGDAGRSRLALARPAFAAAVAAVHAGRASRALLLQFKKSLNVFGIFSYGQGEWEGGSDVPCKNL